MSNLQLTTEEVLLELANAFIHSCNAHIKTTNTIISILQKAISSDKAVEEVSIQAVEEVKIQAEEIVADTEPVDPDNTLMADYDMMMERRVNFHKQAGSYTEPNEKTKVETVQMIAIESPTITPLSKLRYDERDQLEKQLFKEAMYNVEKIMYISRSDSTFKREVITEADRLLKTWIESNKKK